LYGALIAGEPFKRRRSPNEQRPPVDDPRHLAADLPHVAGVSSGNPFYFLFSGVAFRVHFFSV
jgi:hypothetical protein